MRYSVIAIKYMEDITKKEILEAISKLDKKVDVRVKASEEGLLEAICRLDKKVDQKFEVFGKQVDLRFDDFGKQVNSRFDDFGKQVDSKLAEMDRQFTTSENDILEAISTFAEQVDQRFDDVDSRFEGIDTRFLGLESRLTRVEATMVTKSYLDDKLGDLKGDLVSLLRKEDQKVNRFISVLSEKRVLAPAESKDILSFKVFP